MNLKRITRVNLKPVLIIAGVALFVVSGSGCYNSRTGEVKFGGAINFELPAFPQSGPHAVQVFSEMHYSPSYRVQEVPRILPPEDSVPISGKEVKYTSMEAYSDLTVPEAIKQDYDDARVLQLYAVNCAVCHGLSLEGDGKITKLSSKRSDGTPAMDRGPMPANLRSDVTRKSSDGEIFGFISYGGRQGLSAYLRGKPTSSPMPPFAKLLTPDERWELTKFLRIEIGGR
jgi:hypothetical protein